MQKLSQKTKREVVILLVDYFQKHAIQAYIPGCFDVPPDTFRRSLEYCLFQNGTDKTVTDPLAEFKRIVYDD